MDAPQSSVALSWPEDATTDLVEDFIGVVRGRTLNSTRGRTTSQAPAAEEQPRRKPSEGGRGSGKQPGTGRSHRGGSGGSGGAKGAKGARRGKPRRRS